MSEAPRPSGPVILVVDDRAVNIDLARATFEPFGYRVVGAFTAEEALRLARETPPDLILSDVDDNTATGFDLIATVKGDPSLRDIPFVFITSTSQNARARRAGLALGAVRFIFRPIEPQRLLAEIRACLPA